MSCCNHKISDLRGQVARLEKALASERQVSAQWRRKALVHVADRELLLALNRVADLMKGISHDRFN